MGLSLYQQCRRLIFGIFEMSLLRMTGLYQQIYILPLWYLSAVLLVLPVFVWLYAHCRSFFEDLFLVLFSAGVYDFFATAHGALDWWIDPIAGFLRVGVLRVMAGLCLGAISWKLTQRWKKSCRRHLFVGSSTIIFIIVLLVMFVHGSSHLDYLLVSVLMIGIALLMASSAPNCGNTTYRMSCFLGRLSLPLYITHWTVRDVLSLNMA